MSKQEAIDSVLRDKAVLMAEHPLGNSNWIRTYSFNGTRFTIFVEGFAKWLNENTETVIFLN